MIPTFIVVKAVIMSLCKDLATIVNDHLDQLQEYTVCLCTAFYSCYWPLVLQSHLEHYKGELAKDKDLKESVFHAHTAVEQQSMGIS